MLSVTPIDTTLAAHTDAMADVASDAVAVREDDNLSAEGRARQLANLRSTAAEQVERTLVRLRADRAAMRLTPDPQSPDPGVWAERQYWRAALVDDLAGHDTASLLDVLDETIQTSSPAKARETLALVDERIRSGGLQDTLDQPSAARLAELRRRVLSPAELRRDAERHALTALDAFIEQFTYDRTRMADAAVNGSSNVLSMELGILRRDLETAFDAITAVPVDPEQVDRDAAERLVRFEIRRLAERHSPGNEALVTAALEGPATTTGPRRGLGRFITDDGDVDVAALDAEIRQLVADHPVLRPRPAAA